MVVAVVLLLVFGPQLMCHTPLRAAHTEFHYFEQSRLFSSYQRSLPDKARVNQGKVDFCNGLMPHPLDLGLNLSVSKKKKSKGKSDVVVATPWHISAGDQDTKTFLAATGSDSVDASGPSVWLESRRTNLFEELKVQLRRECTLEGQSRYPSMAFERWWLSAKDFAGGLDPLLPTPKLAEDPALVSDLERAGFSRKAASEIARRLASSSEAAAAAIQELATAKKSNREVVEMQRSEEGDEVLLVCKSAGARVRFSGFAYKKLKKLYEFHGLQACPFEKAVMVLGMRYLALGGTG